MSQVDLEKLYNTAKNYALKRGFQHEDAEEFGQECCIRSLNSKEGYIKIDWAFKDYLRFCRADKRILSSSQGQLSAFRTVAAVTSGLGAESDTKQLSDLVADSRNELAEREGVGELEWIIEEILRCANGAARDWARKEYLKYLGSYL